MAGFFLSIALYEQILANFRNYPERGTVLPETKLVDATVLPETKLVDAP
ncbi:hypothetical protein [Microcoleus sp. PH2017_35_SFW_U_B]|nr:hypothetical protein [Microcoleus sp. PH2017_35_SFW_U_B]MCC3556893.1 hypothetical protein [Microcoleus sp. PH2017_35_SFW_U_B]